MPDRELDSVNLNPEGPLKSEEASLAGRFISKAEELVHPVKLSREQSEKLATHNSFDRMMKGNKGVCY